MCILSSNPFAFKLLIFGLIGYFVCELVRRFPKKSKYKIDDIQLAHLEVMYKERVRIVKRTEEEEFLVFVFLGDAPVKNIQALRVWSPMYQRIFSYLEIGDLLILDKELQIRGKKVD